jgi:hypothetical protein
MNEATQQANPRSHARATGAVYLGYFVTTILGLLLKNHNLPGGVMLVRLADVLYAAVTILLYLLFRRAHPLLALAATLCGLAGCVTDLLQQLHIADLAGVSPLVFFGPFCVLLGLLIVQSRFLPHWLGWALIVAGLGWLAYLNPMVARHASIVIMPVGFLAEFVLMLWLLVRGVDEARWGER